MNMYDAIVVDEVSRTNRLPKLNIDNKVIVRPVSELMSLYSGKIQKGCNTPIGFLWKLNVDVIKVNPSVGEYRKIKQQHSILTSSIRLISGLVKVARENDGSLIGLIIGIEKIERLNKTNFVVEKLSDSYKLFISDNKQ